MQDKYHVARKILWKILTPGVKVEIFNAVYGAT